jgi:hypothetical protein
MTIFLDTADLEELRTGAGWGIVDGDVSSEVGRRDDIGQPGMELVRGILAIYRNCGFKTLEG